MKLKILFLFIAMVTLTACSDNEGRTAWEYGEGFEEGFGASCKIRTLLVGEAGADEYLRGYQAGRVARSKDCERNLKEQL